MSCVVCKLLVQLGCVWDALFIGHWRRGGDGVTQIQMFFLTKMSLLLS